MPAYNCSRFIHDAIESIIHQTYTNFELILVDDNSTDATTEIIAEYTKRFSPVVKAVFLQKQCGDTKAANKGFAIAKGDFIARMDADDIAHPTRLEKQIAFFLSHPEVFVLGSQSYVMNADNRLIGEKKFPITHKDIYQKFGVYNPILHPSCMIRRSLLPNPRILYQEIRSIHADYYTFFSYLRYGQFANLSDKLLYYRIHGKNNSLKNPKKRFRAIMTIRKQAVKKLSYNMSFSCKIQNLLQTLAVLLLPEKTIVPLYMLLRGVYTPHLTIKRFSSATTSVPKTSISIKA